MTYVVTIEDVRPSPRYDGTPWVRAVISESAGPDGPWSDIETIVFGDPDANPETPKARDFTTTHALLEQGWYRVKFVDQFGANEQPTAPILNGATQSYEPTVDQVARQITSRTVDEYGNLLGTFNEKTVPTDTQVQAIIQDVMPEIADVIGDEIPDALVDDAQNVVATRAAMQIELNFFSDQVSTGRSVYPQLKDLYDSSLEKLNMAVVSAEQGDGTVTGSGAARLTSYSFPDPMTKLKQVW